MAEDLISTLGGFVSAVAADGVPTPVEEDVTRRVLDVVGITLAARGMGPGEAVSDAVREWAGRQEATQFVTGERLPMPNAALVNGTLAHALDFDDTHLPSVLHPSASVVPAAMAAAEAVGAEGRRLLEAVAVGNEVCIRLGMASYDPELGNSIFFERGFHATSICGALGAAAAAGLLVGLDQEAVTHAMAIAASMGAGLLEANRTGGSVKRVHCGWAAHAGLVAVALARNGITGPPTVLEGRFGFFTAFSDGRFSEEALIGELGERWEVTRTHFKPYPTNHFTHAGIDAALALRADGLEPADIEEIELGVAAPTLRTIAEPPETKARPLDPYAAQFSGPFTVATALLGGSGLGVYLDDFDEETIRDPDRLRLASLVRCVADPQATEAFPMEFPGVLRVRTSDGKRWEHRVRHNRGGPREPLSADELSVKFRANASRSLEEERVTALEETILGLSGIDDLGALFGLLRT